MRKTLATFLAAAALTVPFAQAQTSTITVGLTYDRALLVTESGAKLVLASLEKQATEACSYSSPVSRAPTHDSTCRQELIEKAIDEIRRASLEEGIAASSVFASREASAASPAQ